MKNILNVLTETKNMKTTNIGKRISFEDMKCVWEQISHQIIKFLQQKKSVILKGIGTFTLKKWKLDAGIQHEVKFFKPIFFLSKALLEEYDLHQRKEYATDTIPVTVLKLNEIVKTNNYTKEKVLYCLDEVIQSLRQLIAEEKNIRMEFPELGVLKIVNTVATFTFYRELKPDVSIPEQSCHRYQHATKPNQKKINYPCHIHEVAFTE